ncbi:hypothetical protein ACJJIK_15695 [Microbulbifer sp. ZKSA006]|uniref:hypothetical protein n=1 Tax=Microbulbifer sp. ZKSA006 TaxID=3243390 RepID=UPI004039A274
MNVKKLLIIISLLAGSLVALPALSADLECTLNVKSGGHVYGNGTSHCGGLDFSFGSSTSGKWEITNITKSIDYVNWINGCSSGLSCSVTVQAYSSNLAKVYIHYTDGSIEYLSGSMSYETGY